MEIQKENKSNNIQKLKKVIENMINLICEKTKNILYNPNKEEKKSKKERIKKCEYLKKNRQTIKYVNKNAKEAIETNISYLNQYIECSENPIWADIFIKQVILIIECTKPYTSLKHDKYYEILSKLIIPAFKKEIEYLKYVIQNKLTEDKTNDEVELLNKSISHWIEKSIYIHDLEEKEEFGKYLEEIKKLLV